MPEYRMGNTSDCLHMMTEENSLMYMLLTCHPTARRSVIGLKMLGRGKFDG